MGVGLGGEKRVLEGRVRMLFHIHELAHRSLRLFSSVQCHVNFAGKVLKPFTNANTVSQAFLSTHPRECCSIR